MKEKSMKVTTEMYTKLFNSITDANAKLQQARKYIVQAELILNGAQTAAEDILLGEEE